MIADLFQRSDAVLNGDREADWAVSQAGRRGNVAYYVLCSPPLSCLPVNNID